MARRVPVPAAAARACQRSDRQQRLALDPVANCSKQATTRARIGWLCAYGVYLLLMTTVIGIVASLRRN